MPTKLPLRVGCYSRPDESAKTAGRLLWAGDDFAAVFASLLDAGGVRLHSTLSLLIAKECRTRGDARGFVEFPGSFVLRFLLVRALSLLGTDVGAQL